MANYKYDLNEIYKATNNGLDIILKYYPEAQKNGRFVNFKIRDENTASACICPAQKSPSGNAFIKDFGGRNYQPIDLVMEHENLEFLDALKFIANDFKIPGLTSQFSKAKYKEKLAPKNAKLNSHTFDFKDQLTEYELKNIGAFVTQEQCDQYSLKTVNSYTKVKIFKPGSKKYEQYGDKKIIQTTLSTESYPIYVFDLKKWQKIYKPLNEDKRFRFAYAGDKPTNFVFGLSQLQKEYEQLQKQYKIDSQEAIKGGFPLGKDKEDYRVEKVIICGGDRDAFNAISLGYFAVWLNSETAKLPYEVYKQLKKYAKEILYCGDIDDTGFSETKKLAKQYIDIKIIRLPEWLKNYTYRKKPKKDLKDFVDTLANQKKDDEDDKALKYVKKQFDKLVKNALPFKFWFEKFDAKGKFKGWDISNEALIQFMEFEGFYKYKDEYSKEDYNYIKFIEDANKVKTNKIQKVSESDLEAHPVNYLKKTYQPISLINFTIRSPQIKAQKLNTLPIIDLKLSRNDKNTQRFYFKNGIATIKKDKITLDHYSESLDYQLFEDQIIDRNFKIPKKPPFKIFLNDKEEWDIEILDHNNDFLNFCINTARIHWRHTHEHQFLKREKVIINDKSLSSEEKDKALKKIQQEKLEYRLNHKFKIDEKNLTDKQIAEQKLVLINRIFAFGYLLHGYKVESKAWLVYAMDNRISENNDSNGGSGKSLVFLKALKVLQNIVAPPSSTLKKSEDTFSLSNVNDQTSTVIYNDLAKNFPFRSVYELVTEDFSVRIMHKGYKTIPFAHSPKLVVTTNFALYDDGSSNRRVLFSTFSDYYHAKSDLDDQSYEPKHDFTEDFFTEWDQKQWDDYHNFAFSSLQFYLNTNKKIDPPNTNIQKRNALQKIGSYDGFLDWADVYFENPNNRDVHLCKIDLYNSFKDYIGSTKLKPQKFKTKLQEYCKLKEWKFNPPRLDSVNDDGRIMKTVSYTNFEFVYIQTPGKDLTNYWNVPSDKQDVVDNVSGADPKPHDEDTGNTPPWEENNPNNIIDSIE